MREQRGAYRDRGWRSKTVVGMGLASLLNDAASEAVVPLLPFFLTTVLGAGALTLGWIEGLADAAASLLKLLSGRWADRLGRSRPLVVGGYALAALARPLLALAGSAGQVGGLRLLDRAGKGLRSSPRDTWLAGAVRRRERASAFGLQRAMDHVGAVCGPLAAFAFLAVAGSERIRLLFALAAIPGALCVLVVLSLRERPRLVPARLAAVGFRPRRGFAPMVAVMGVVSLGRASELFLLLTAGAVRAPLATLPLLWMGLHVARAATSVAGGRLADCWSGRPLLGVAWGLQAAVYTALAFAPSAALVALLAVGHGAVAGLAEGPERSMVAAASPPRARGAGFGWYYLTTGLGALGASVLFGWLWEVAGREWAFLAAAALTAAGVVGWLCLGGRRPDAAAS